MPEITVVIPTYNWSEALQISIPAVLAQTCSDFELLVVGDCCTDDSEQVARSFGDPRVRWYNLPERAGSQSGPNNFAAQIAAGEFIAYLGHDDVWHPDHLRSLLARMEETGADLGCGVTCMYGPPGSGIRGLSGIFIEGCYRKEDFFPPSSMMHRRSLVARIGPWRLPDSIADPVDCDFLRRAYESGALIVSTDRLTVFKFNSAWRRDSYIRREVGEQRRMLARLREDPDRCVESEWADLVRSAREKRMIETVLPAGTSYPLGHYHYLNLRNRGLEKLELRRLVEPTKFTLEDQPSALEWHGVESVDGRGPFRWSGPSPVALIALPVIAPSRFRLRIVVLNWIGTDFAAEISLCVAGHPVAFACYGSGQPDVTLESEVTALEPQSGPLRIQLKVSRLRCPYFETGGASPDMRWLGVCVESVEVVPL
jgi:glycosyltransferase involved in cell wall biosynthesis